jgi:membrane protease YdiL (CAAX protease family)
MFLLQGDKGKNSFFLYCLSFSFILFLFVIVGHLPMLMAADNVSSLLSNEDLTSVLVNQIGSNRFFVYALLPFIIGLIGLVFSVRYFHQRSTLTLFSSRDQFSWRRFFFSFFLWGSVMSVSLLISYLLGYPIVYNLNPNTFFLLFLISLLLLPLQTTFEEVLFRGYLFQAFGTFFRKGWISVLVTGILFGLMHGANPEVDRIGSVLLVYYIMTGVFLGVMTLMDDGLELSMGYHAANNIFAAIVVTNDWQAFHTDAFFMDKTPPSFGLENILTLVVLQPLIIFVFAKKYKWSNWKKRLFNTQISEKE